MSVPFLDTRLWAVAWFGLVPLVRHRSLARSVRTAALYGLVMGFVVNVVGFHWVVTHHHALRRVPIADRLAVLHDPLALQRPALRAGRCRPALGRAPACPLAARTRAVDGDRVPLSRASSPGASRTRSASVTLSAADGDLTGPLLLVLRDGVVRGRRRAVAAAASPSRRPDRDRARRRLRGVARLDRSTPRSRRRLPSRSASCREICARREAPRRLLRIERRSLPAALAGLSPAPDLLVWPETVVEWGSRSRRRPCERFDPVPGSAIAAAVRRGRVSRRGRERSSGSTAHSSAAPTARLGGRYDKIVLMPFGEFIPFASLFPWLKDLSPNTGDFLAGTGPVVLPVSAEARVGALDLLRGPARGPRPPHGRRGSEPAARDRQRRLVRRQRSPSRARHPGAVACGREPALPRASPPTPALTSVIDPTGRVAASRSCPSQRRPLPVVGVHRSAEATLIPAVGRRFRLFRTGTRACASAMLSRSVDVAQTHGVASSEGRSGVIGWRCLGAQLAAGGRQSARGDPLSQSRQLPECRLVPRPSGSSTRATRARHAGRRHDVSEFYGLTEKPFSQTPDPRFLYWNDAYRETSRACATASRSAKASSR